MDGLFLKQLWSTNISEDWCSLALNARVSDSKWKLQSHDRRKCLPRLELGREDSRRGF
jgi:hypothetical protein